MSNPPAAARLRVLIVEDDPAQRTGLAQLVESWGFETSTANDGEQALARVETTPPDVIISDLVMPKIGGLDLLRAIAQKDHDITTLILTAQGTVDTAIEAIRLGAYDYVAKPVDPQRLRILLDQVVERHERQREVAVLRRQLRDHGRFGTMVGASVEMRKVYQLIEQAAPTQASVLISGESGTGKELAAQTLHQLSPRASRPFVPINCAAIPETLLESELFGHEKGAFTGAIARRQGSFELADRGTLFLDEISEMTPSTQAKLLRVIQERTVRPVGGERERAIDIRIIAATNQDPLEAVKQGRLREDLYYRLNVLGVRMPPLRDRLSDLPLLTHAFVTEFAKQQQKSIAGVDDPALAKLGAYRWPGNVRELRNVIERATIIAKGQFIGPADLPGIPAAGAAVPAPSSPAPSTSSASPGPPALGALLSPGMTVDEAERRLIELTLEHTGGNKTRAAAMLDISLKTLHNKLARQAAERLAN